MPPRTTGIVCGIYVAPIAGDPMQPRREVEAIIGEGLFGDRYREGKGSWNKDHPGRRQVTLINAAFFPGSGFRYPDARRNIVVGNIELMRLVGKKFTIGGAVFCGVKYCTPCKRPSTLARIDRSFQEAFFDRGGIIAEVLVGGMIQVGNKVAILKDTQ